LVLTRRSASSEPMLAPREEARLIAAWQRDRDEGARDRVVRAYARLCYGVAARYASNPDRVEDLAQEGMFGLLRALDLYDPKRGTRFSTYSRMWIRSFVSNAVARVSTVVDVPSRTFLSIRSGRVEAGMEAAVAASAPPVSLDAPAKDGEVELVDRLASPDRNPEEIMDGITTREFHARLVEASLSALTDRERAIVVRRSLSAVPETLEEIAADLGLTRERIRQIEVGALDKMRRDLVRRTGGAAMLD